MSMEMIHTAQAPSAIGPYSQGYIAGDFLFTSGQGGLDPETGAVVGTDVTTQAEQTMRNLKAIFDRVGTDFAHAVKTTCFLEDMRDFTAFNGVYEQYFTSKPARSCVAVKELPLGILCEVEAVVYLPGVQHEAVYR